MRIYSLIIAFFFTLLLNGQGGFKVRHAIPNSLNGNTKALFESSPGNYIGFGYSYDADLHANRIVVTGLDSQGQLVWLKKYGDETFKYLNNPFISRMFYKQGDFIYWAGSVRDTNNRSVGALIKFDLNGDTLWQKIYRDADSLEDVIPQMVTGSVDGGFLITGFFQHWGDNPYRKTLLIKTDADGNELWRKKIGQNTQDGKAIIQDSASKKIVTVGYQYSNGLNNYDNVLILDSLGNLLFQHSYAASPGGMLTDLIQTKDTKCVAVGYQFSNQTIGGNNLMQAFAVKFDIDNYTTPIWRIHDFGKLGLNNGFACLKELNNGDVIVGGFIDTLHGVINAPNDVIPNMHNRLTILDNNGHVKWNRYYNYKTNSSTQIHLSSLLSIELCQDGSWLAAISVLNTAPNPFFFVKYDSTGCDSTELYCATTYTLGLNSLNRNETVRIFPNPVKDVLSVETGIPQDIDISVYDVSGREVKTIKLNPGNKIHVSDLSSGLYLITISRDKEVIYTTKLIKEN